MKLDIHNMKRIHQNSSDDNDNSNNDNNIIIIIIIMIIEEQNNTTTTTTTKILIIIVIIIQCNIATTTKPRVGEWNKTMFFFIECSNLHQGQVLRDFTQGIVKNCDSCEPDVLRFKPLLYRQEVLVCTESITRTKTRGGGLLRLTETKNHPGVHLQLKSIFAQQSPPQCNFLAGKCLKSN